MNLYSSDVAVFAKMVNIYSDFDINIFFSFRLLIFCYQDRDIKFTYDSTQMNLPNYSLRHSPKSVFLFVEVYDFFIFIFMITICY